MNDVVFITVGVYFNINISLVSRPFEGEKKRPGNEATCI